MVYFSRISCICITHLELIRIVKLHCITFLFLQSFVCDQHLNFYWGGDRDKVQLHHMQSIWLYRIDLTRVHQKLDAPQSVISSLLKSFSLLVADQNNIEIQTDLMHWLFNDNHFPLGLTMGATFFFSLSLNSRNTCAIKSTLGNWPYRGRLCVYVSGAKLVQRLAHRKFMGISNLFFALLGPRNYLGSASAYAISRLLLYALPILILRKLSVSNPYIHQETR